MNRKRGPNVQCSLSAIAFEIAKLKIKNIFWQNAKRIKNVMKSNYLIMMTLFLIYVCPEQKLEFDSVSTLLLLGLCF